MSQDGSQTKMTEKNDIIFAIDDAKPQNDHSNVHPRIREDPGVIAQSDALAAVREKRTDSCLSQSAHLPSSIIPRKTRQSGDFEGLEVRSAPHGYLI